jgi:hypothetical protein
LLVQIGVLKAKPAERSAELKVRLYERVGV